MIRQNEMLKFNFDIKKKHALKILCLGAHSDDIEIGCGGTILRLLNEYGQIHVYWVVFAANEVRKAEAEGSAKLFLEKASKRDIIIKNFRESFFPYSGDKIKVYFESIKSEYNPDIIFTHYQHDLHQDHRLICDLTWNTFRDHLILEYEIPKYDGDLGRPNFFVRLDESICNLKVNNILKCFQSQSEKQWFNCKTFQSLLHLRGIESKASDAYAEAYYCRKVIL